MKIPHILCFLIVLLFLGACQSTHVDGPGHRQAELRHKKAMMLHQYLQEEVAMVLKAREEMNEKVAIGHLTSLVRERLKGKDCQLENYQELLQRQAITLENQQKYLRDHETQHLTIRQREMQHNQIRRELGTIKKEVLVACNEINKLAATYKQARNGLPILATLR